MLEFVKGAVRSTIGAAEHVEDDVESHSPAAIEAKLDEMIAVLHRTCESAQRHVEVAEGIASTLVPLTDSVTKLTEQIILLLQVMAPLASAEHDLSRVEGLFRRHRGGEPAPASGISGAQLPPAPDG
jgi:hypothetical protein